MNVLRNKPALGLAAIAVLGAGVWWMFDGSQAARPALVPAPIPVVVMQVERRNVPHLTSAVGTVQSLHSVTIRSQADGVLTDVLFQEGQLVRAGEVLARIDDRAFVAALDQARAERARSVAQLESGRIDLDRYTNLLKDKTVPKQTVDQQAALVEQLKAAVDANDAAIAAAQVRLSYTRITSPISGRIGMRRVDPGNLVRGQDADGLVAVTQIDPIAVVFSLPQDLLPRIQEILGGASPVPVIALDRHGGTVLGEGRLTLIDNQIDSRTGTIRVKAEFPNPDGRLWPGQFVTVQLQTGSSPGALVVSAAAVQRGIDQFFVYRIAGGQAEMVPIIIHYEDEDIAVISGDLLEGDPVVRDGQARLKPGIPVKVVESSAAGAAEIGNGR